jgi:hypothetical protein
MPATVAATMAQTFGRALRHHRDWRTALHWVIECRQEMNERMPRSEPPDVRGGYFEQCMAAHGYQM